jgi:hypothetical protein
VGPESSFRVLFCQVPATRKAFWVLIKQIGRWRGIEKRVVSHGVVRLQKLDLKVVIARRSVNVRHDSCTCGVVCPLCTRNAICSCPEVKYPGGESILNVDLPPSTTCWFLYLFSPSNEARHRSLMVVSYWFMNDGQHPRMASTFPKTHRHSRSAPIKEQIARTSHDVYRGLCIMEAQLYKIPKAV